MKHITVAQRQSKFLYEVRHVFRYLVENVLLCNKKHATEYKMSSNAS